MQNKSKTVYTNLMWRLLERFGAQGVTLVVSLILARLLDPDTYGTVALITIFTSILNVFVDSGLANSLIQKKNADDVDFSSVFYFNVLICCLLYIIMFVSAPAISRFYNKPEIVPMIRVLSLTLIISGIKNVQQAYVSKNMMFKKFFFSTLGGTLTASIIGIALAILGKGAWALIIQNITNLLMDTIILWLTVKWRPKLLFSWKRLKGLLSYGYKLLLVSLINNIYNECRQLIIGKMYSSSDLACYNQGNRFPQIIVQNLNTAIDNVVFSAMSAAQDEITEVRNMTRRSIRTGSFILAPLMVGMACVSKSVVLLILTDKWIACVPYLQIFCIMYLFTPIQTANLNAIKAIGKSGVFFIIDILEIGVGLIGLLVTMWFGPIYIASSMLICTILGLFINSFPNKKYLNYGIKEQIKDLLPNLLLAIVMGIIVYNINFLHLSPIVSLILQIPLGAIIYIGGAALLKLESFGYCLKILSELLKMKKSRS